MKRGALKNSKKTNWKVLIISLIIVYGIAFLGSIFTSSKVNTDWYNSIRPAITPPNYVFPIVWNILFFLIAISLYLAWTNSNKKQKTKVTVVFGINLILNVLWSLLYFGLQNPFYAFIDLILIWFSILAMIKITSTISKKASYLLLPYLFWVSFAGILNWLSIFK